MQVTIQKSQLVQFFNLLLVAVALTALLIAFFTNFKFSLLIAFAIPVIVFGSWFAIYVIPFFYMVYLMHRFAHTMLRAKVIMLSVFCVFFALAICLITRLDLTDQLHEFLRVGFMGQQDLGKSLLSVLMYQIYLVPMALIALFTGPALARNPSRMRLLERIFTAIYGLFLVGGVGIMAISLLSILL